MAMRPCFAHALLDVGDALVSNEHRDNLRADQAGAGPARWFQPGPSSLQSSWLRMGSHTGVNLVKVKCYAQVSAGLPKGLQMVCPTNTQ